MSRVKLYCTRTCSYCIRAKELLDRKHIAYEVIDVSGDEETRDWLYATTGRSTVPQVFIDGEAIGGYRELCVLDRTGDLEKRFAPALPE